ncbi:MAG: 4-hydroxythreonine-4-phosphate dehydrogenase 2 [Alphaproteobacteria bacterium MarineAlpha9_Bin3]|nr:MAG: 4-hydroxythreonine-4-phosphate dehydrogenase 2 [Alphaproteobacteria bacterium MarineAlpha9_Bin3]|tara:strand:+ start:866 stop:1858 length:993 start_codon:yes stop_codon:yes gene_type:complete
MSLPIIGITMGDPAGIGPEIIVKSLMNDKLYGNFQLLVIGDSNCLEHEIKKNNLVLDINICSSIEDIKNSGKHIINCLNIGKKISNIKYGIHSDIYGEASYQYICEAVNLALTKKINAICTAPISKKALQMAGHNFPGHTELLAYLTNTKEVSLMLSTPKMNVIHVTAHIGLIEAIKKINSDLVFRTIERGRNITKQLINKDPKIGVCAINPHAGEEGLFGNNEEEIKILPAINKALNFEWNIKGPLPTDSLFYQAGLKKFDLIVAMYHDQGHGPVKVMGIDDGINITVGLPLIRTSVDHGTAFDISGKGIAKETNMINAINKAYYLIKK